MSIDAAALILAAGSSSRMGRSKQLLNYRGAPLLVRAVAAAKEAGLSPIIVVTRPDGDDVAAMRRLLTAEPIQWVENPLWERGMGTTIRAGMAALEEASVDAVMLMVCDQPLITHTHLRALVLALTDDEKTIAAAEYAGTVGVPALFRREHFQALSTMPDGGGAKGLLQGENSARALVSMPEAAVDVDDEAAYRRLLDQPTRDS